VNAVSYKANAGDALNRLRSLWERRAADRVFAAFSIPSKTMADFAERRPAGFCDYPDPADRIEFWDRLLQETRTLEDDSIPSAYLSEFDQGLYGGVLGGDVRFLCDPETGWISSMVPPLLDDWSGFESLAFSESHPWFQRYLRQLRVFTERARGRFGVSHLILIDGLNFVFELVGATQTYISLLECPEMVREAIDFAFDLNVKIQNVFFNAVQASSEGTFSNMAQWLPGRIVSESIDPFHMTSVKDFETWGREPAQRIFDEFDGGVLHIHGNGRHLLEAACSLRGLKAIYVGDDRGFPRAFDVLDELRARAGDVPLVVQAAFHEFAERLDQHALPGGVLCHIKGAESIDSANRCMEKVRSYRV